MEHPSLLTEIILTNPHQTLDCVQLDWHPQPGAYLEVSGEPYTVLERRHRYQLRDGRYQLCKISLYVQTGDRPAEQSLVAGRWLIGDATCRFNAQSELLRCAVNPKGPCKSCHDYEPL